ANQLRANGNIRPVGFLDDDSRKIGLLVAGLKVLGPFSMLSAVATKHDIQQVIVCIASPPRETLRRIWALSEPLGITVKTVPTLAEILERKIKIVNLRNVEMNDLLGREPIQQPADDPEVNAAYSV